MLFTDLLELPEMIPLKGVLVLAFHRLRNLVNDMRHVIVLVALLVLVAGCSTTAVVRSPDISPISAVVGASDHPVTGSFIMQVRAAGRQYDILYLNSEIDYRDQRCLTIAIPNAVATELQAKVGGDPEQVLVGKKIRVTGTARRVTIWFFNGAVKSDKYYFQTHVNVSVVSQITILDP